MKAILEFDTSDPEEKDRLARALKADDMINVIWEFLREVRKDCEREIEAKNITGYGILDYTMDRLNELLDDNGINLDELWK